MKNNIKREKEYASMKKDDVVNAKQLTEKQKVFAMEFLKDFNATQACIRAGYSKKTARQIGSENLSKPVIAQYLQSLMDKRAEECELSAEYVLKNLKMVAERCMQTVAVRDAGGNDTGFFGSTVQEQTGLWSL